MVGERYPEAAYVTRLGDAAPVVLHGVGDTSLLNDDGVGVVGSRDGLAGGFRRSPVRLAGRGATGSTRGFRGGTRCRSATR